jgi:hypothetical protein
VAPEPGRSARWLFALLSATLSPAAGAEPARSVRGVLRLDNDRVRRGVCEVVISVHRESLAVQANGRSE